VSAPVGWRSERYCLPSIAAQNVRNFHWLVYFDVETPPSFPERIEAWSRRVPFMAYYTPHFQADNHMKMAEHGPVHQIGGPAAWLQVVHGHNVSNKIRGRRISAEEARRALPDNLLGPLRPASAAEIEAIARQWQRGRGCAVEHALFESGCLNSLGPYKRPSETGAHPAQNHAGSLTEGCQIHGGHCKTAGALVASAGVFVLASA
jgi:hypothetical protein